MLKSTFLLITALILVQTSFAQTTYYTGWDNTSESAGWTQIKKGDTGFYEWVKDGSTSVSPDSCLAHYYPVGGSVATDDWYVSPVFDFSAGGWIDTLWHNYNGFGTPMAGDTIVLYLLNGSSDPDLATKTVLYSFSDSTYNPDNTWYEELMIPVGTHAGNSYLAFRYYTTNNWLDVKFDNLFVTSFSNASINDIDFADDIAIYPNPTSKTANIDLMPKFRNDLISINIYDNSGRKIKEVNINENSIDVSSFHAGSYFIHFNSLSKNIVRKLVIN